MTTDILTLRKADWKKIEKDVVERIRTLKNISEKLEPNPITDKIAQDLIVPALGLLGQFCASVTMEEEK